MEGVPAPVRSRLLGALTVVLLAATGCQGDGGEPAASGEPDQPTESASSAEPEPPGPAERLGLRTGWGPTERELDDAVRQVRRLPLPALAGQVIVASWSGTAAPVRTVRDLHLGGVIAFDENLTSPGQTAAGDDHAAAAGGPAAGRCSSPSTRRAASSSGPATTSFPAFMSAGAAGDPELTTRVYRKYAAELAGLGFTVDFAPDADVTSGPSDPTIGSRSAGSDPRLVGAAGGAPRRAGCRAAAWCRCSSTSRATARSPPTATSRCRCRTVRSGSCAGSTWRPSPPRSTTACPAVMTGHLDIRAVDPRTPATLSRPVVTGLLRRELGFEGLVVTDSLQMDAVTAGRSAGSVAVRALAAGNDVLLMPTDPAVARTAIVRAVRSGDLSRTRLLQSAARQVALLEHTRSDARRPGRRRSRRVARPVRGRRDHGLRAVPRRRGRRGGRRQR